MSTEIQRRATPDQLPSSQVAEAITGALEGLRAVRTFIDQEFRDGTDYGVIPGCGDKPTLFLPGAQKAMMYFNSRPERDIERIDLGGGHVQFLVTTRIISRSTGQVVGEGVGCCSTMESKYRYRNAERTCPACGKAAIIKGKEEYGGGWLCFKKKDGCGAKFNQGNRAIESQPQGQVENKDLYDVHNTVLKMGKKRADVDAAMTLGCLSELFTQDIEDTFPMVEVREAARPAEAEEHHVDGEVVAPPPKGQKFESNDSGHGRTGVYGSPQQVAAMASDLAHQYEDTRQKWEDAWITANREFPPGLAPHPVPKPMLANHLLKQAIREGRLRELPETFDAETGERVAKVSTEETKKLLAVAHSRDRKWMLDEIWFYFWEKGARVARDFFDANPNWTVPPEFDLAPDDDSAAGAELVESVPATIARETIEKVNDRHGDPASGDHWDDGRE